LDGFKDHANKNFDLQQPPAEQELQAIRPRRRCRRREQPGLGHQASRVFLACHEAHRLRKFGGSRSISAER
jgi:hypothetical protein